MNLTINSDQSLQRAIGDLRQMFREYKFVRVTAKSGKHRSTDFSALSHCWYEQVAAELREGTALDVKCEAKLRYGVPIMRAEDQSFREFFDAALAHLTYEQQLQAMKWVPLTSLMTNAQLKQFCDEMQADYRGRVELEYPPEKPS